MASQSRAAKYDLRARLTLVAAFSTRRACVCSSANRASAASRFVSSKISQRPHRSPSTVKSVICRHSASKSSCEVPRDACVTTAPTSFSRCTDSINV